MLDARILKGIEEFNHQQYFEAHDSWEDFWTEYSAADRLFFQGLIQMTVGCYHLSNRNYKGGLSQFTKSSKKLVEFPGDYLGMNLSELLEWMKKYRGDLVEGKEIEFIPFMIKLSF